MEAPESPRPHIIPQKYIARILVNFSSSIGIESMVEKPSANSLSVSSSTKFELNSFIGCDDDNDDDIPVVGVFFGLELKYLLACKNKLDIMYFHAL